MKFSSETLAILKNFATINPGLLFTPGSQLKTMHPHKSIVGSATITEKLDTEAGIFDLSKLLSTLTLFDDYDVEFLDKKLVIKGGSSKLNYTYAAKEMITLPPAKDIQIPSPEADLAITWKDIDGVIRAAGVLKLTEMCFNGDESGVYMSTMDTKNPTSDSYTSKISDVSSTDFKVIVKVENLKLMPMDYQVQISSKGLIYFKGVGVEYWVACQSA